MARPRDLNRIKELSTLPDETLITTADMALLMGCSESWLAIDRTQPPPRGGALAKAGIVPVKVGKIVRYRLGDVSKLTPAEPELAQ